MVDEWNPVCAEPNLTPRTSAPPSLAVHPSDTSGLASPENYVQFPQPFSGFDVPVLPYAMGNGNTYRGHGSNGSSSSRAGGEVGGSGGVGQMSARRPEPEIDVTDLVMDNNDYYTPDVATKSKSLEEAALVVAVAAASTKAGAGAGSGPGTGKSGDSEENKVFRSSSSRGRRCHVPPPKGFVSLDSESSGVSNSHHNGSSSHDHHNNHNNHHHLLTNNNDKPGGVSEEERLALPAVAGNTSTAAVTMAAASATTPSISSGFFDTDNIAGFAGNNDAATSRDNATSTDEGTSFEDQTNSNNTRSTNAFMLNSEPPSVDTVHDQEGGVAVRAPTEGGSRSHNTSSGGGGGNQRGSNSSQDREGSENYTGAGRGSRSSSSDVLPTPMSMPALV